MTKLTSKLMRSLIAISLIITTLSACGSQMLENATTSTGTTTTVNNATAPTESTTTKPNPLEPKSDDGFIGNDAEEIDKLLTENGVNVKAVNAATIYSDFLLSDGNSINDIYVFAMVNVEDVKVYTDEPVEENIDNQTSSTTTPATTSTTALATTTTAEEPLEAYLSALIMEDNTYIVSFGNNISSSYEEALPYCKSGKYVEYWAFATLNPDAQIVLIPIIAGTEDSGYYLVQSSLRDMTDDFNDLKLPEPVGDDYDITELKEQMTATSTATPKSTETPEETTTSETAESTTTTTHNHEH